MNVAGFSKFTFLLLLLPVLSFAEIIGTPIYNPYPTPPIPIGTPIYTSYPTSPTYTAPATPGRQYVELYRETIYAVVGGSEANQVEDECYRKVVKTYLNFANKCCNNDAMDSGSAEWQGDCHDPQSTVNIWDGKRKVKWINSSLSETCYKAVRLYSTSVNNQLSVYWMASSPILTIACYGAR